jgi:hypothetical protein
VARIGQLAAALERLNRRHPPPFAGDHRRTDLPEVYGELTQVHRWSPDAYEAWLADALASAMDGSRGGH